MIQSIKAYAVQVSKRINKREQVREANREVEFFSTRHPRDMSKLACEMSAMQIGTKAVVEQSYRRVGDKTTKLQSFCSDTPWQGVNGVPDMDQVLNSSPSNREKKSQSRQEAPKKKEPVVDMAEVKTAGVFETFRDRNDEMQFLVMRHLLAKEFRELSRRKRYAGAYVSETEIPDKRTFFFAQDVLQLTSIQYSEELVKELRKLNSFCVTRQIPEQDRVTGEWSSFTAVKRELIATYPPCTDWKLLSEERERLEYVVENYKLELVKIIRTCAQRGAQTPVDIDETSTVDRVHSAYFHLVGHLRACKRCLFPMASKATLVQLRIMWPRVQDTQFPDVCRNCNSTAFSVDSSSPVFLRRSRHESSASPKPSSS